MTVRGFYGEIYSRSGRVRRVGEGGERLEEYFINGVNVRMGEFRREEGFYLYFNRFFVSL